MNPYQQSSARHLPPIHHRGAKRTTPHYERALMNVHTQNLTEESCCYYISTTHTAHACCPLRTRHLPTIERRRGRTVRAASIHSSIHLRTPICTPTDCTGLVTKSSQQQTSKRASESIAQETDRTRVRNGRAASQVPTIPAPKQAHSLARSLAHSRLAALPSLSMHACA